MNTFSIILVFVFTIFIIIFLNFDKIQETNIQLKEYNEYISTFENEKYYTNLNDVYCNNKCRDSFNNIKFLYNEHYTK